MSSWYKLKIGKFEIRYTPLNQAESYPYCDSNKNILERVNETAQQEQRLLEVESELKKTPDNVELQKEREVIKRLNSLKAYYINKKTGEKFEKAFKLINDKPTSELKKTESTEKFIYCDSEEIDNLIIDKEYLVRGEELYNDLKDKGKAIKVAVSFGRGHKAYRCIITPSRHYKGFCDMRVGTGYKSEIVVAKVQELEENERLKELLKQINMENSGVVAKAEDLITL